MMLFRDIELLEVKITAIQIQLSTYALIAGIPLPGLAGASDSLDKSIAHLEAARAALLNAGTAIRVMRNYFSPSEETL